MVSGAPALTPPVVDAAPAEQPGPAPQEASLADQVFGTYGTRALTIGLGMIMGIITARVLGPHDRGVFSLVYLLPSTVVTLAKMGLAQASVYSIRREHVAADRVAGNALVVSIILGTTFAVLAFVFREQLLATVLRGVPAWAMLIALPLIPVLLFESYFYSILQALGQFSFYNRRLLVGTVLLVLGMATFLIGFHGGLSAAILVVVCTPIVMDTWLLFTVRRWFSLSLRLDRELLNRQVRFGLKSHVQVLAQHLHLRADAYLLAWFLNPAEVAFYTLAVRLAEFMLDIPESVGMVLYPRLASLDEHAMHELTAQACRRTVMVTTIAAIALNLAGPFLIVLWYGIDYAPAAKPLPLISFGIIMMSIFVMLTRNFTSRNKQQINIIAGFMALVANVSLNLFLIPAMGIVGAALASALSYSAAATLLIIFFLRESHYSLASILVPSREDFTFFWRLAVRLAGRSKQFVLRSV